MPAVTVSRKKKIANKVTDKMDVNRLKLKFKIGRRRF